MHENQHKPGDTFMPANQKVVSPPVAPAAASNVPQSPLPSTPPPPTTAVAPAVATTQLPTPPIPLSPPASQSAPSPYAVPAPTPVVGSVKTKRKMRTLLLSIAAVVLFGGAGAFAYLGVYLPNKPENVVGQAFLNLISVDSLQYEGKSSFSGGLFSGNLEFKGGSSQSTSKFTFGATLDFGDDSIELNLRGIDKKLYLQIGKSDALASLLGGVLGGGSKEFQSSIGQLLASISQQWYEIEGDEFGQDFSVTPDLDEEQQQQISDTLKSHKLFDITAVHEDESIKDQNTKHYTLKLSEEGLKAAADDMEGFILSGQTLTRETIDEFKTVLDEMDDKLLTFDVWIYSESKQLAKLAFTSEDESVNTQLELVFFGHNEQFEVQIPENVKPIDELLADLFPVSEGLQANGIQSRASDTERRTDINAIATHLEAYYADHGYYPKSILGDVLTKGSFKLDPEALIDPDGQAVDSGDYSYEATNCSGNECEQFTLSAKLEAESAPYEKQSLN